MFKVTRKGMNSVISIGKLPIGEFINHSIKKDNINPNEILLPPTQFKEYPEFKPILLKTIKNNIEYYKEEARVIKDGFMNVNNKRGFTVGRTSDCEDIFGVVLVENGKIVTGTFEEMPTFRIYNSKGFFQLDPELLNKLVI